MLVQQERLLRRIRRLRRWQRRTQLQKRESKEYSELDFKLPCVCLSNIEKKWRIFNCVYAMLSVVVGRSVDFLLDICAVKEEWVSWADS